MNTEVLILFPIGMIILLGLMAEAIIIIIVTRNKSNKIQKVLHYLGIGALCIISICLLPILCNFLGDLIFIAIIILLVIWFRRK